jgi:bacterioferritin (cytochrome b1)
MQATERELWILNLYRNSELHGALLMGRLARSVSDTELLVNATRHCATEARHAAMLSEAIVIAGGNIDPKIPTIQEQYSAIGGVPTALADVLVLSEVLEHRVLTRYRTHLNEPGIHPVIRQCLQEILREMEEEHGAEHAGWIDHALDDLPRDTVEAAEKKWRGVDETVVAELERDVNARFAEARA